MKSLSQDKYIEISYLSSGKWDKLDKSGMVISQPCLIYWSSQERTFSVHTVITPSIGTPYLLTILVLKFETVHSTIS